MLLTEGEAGAVDALPGPEAVEAGREVTEVTMPQRLLRRHAPVGSWLQHHTRHVLGKRDLIEARPHVAQAGLGPVVAELVRPVVGEPGDPGPGVLGGGAHHPEYLVQLVPGVPHPGEAGVAIEHLYEDAARPPHVQAHRVVGAPQQHVRRPVPASCIMSERRVMACPIMRALS